MAACRERFIALVVGVACVLIAIPFFGNWGSYWGGVGGLLAPQEPQYDAMTDPGSSGPDYPPFWVTEDYWVTESCKTSSQTKEAAEQILAKLDADNIAKMAVVCMPYGSVSIPGDWSVRYGRFYGIGLPDGPRANNGAIWLVQHDEEGNVQVSYAMGDGLPAITAGELGPIIKQAEAEFQTNGLDASIMLLAERFDAAARANYEPFEPREPVYGGPIEKESDGRIWAACILGGLILFIATVLVSEPLLALGVIFLGNMTAWELMAWPIWLLKLIWNAITSGSGGGGYRRGTTTYGTGGTATPRPSKSAGGGTGFHRNRS